MNWRLPALQDAIARHRAPTFDEMFVGTRGDFDGKRGPMLYATARYLLYYLQERGRLVRFYRAFRAAVVADPTGRATLGSVVGGDAGALRREWEGFVSDLHFERR